MPISPGGWKDAGFDNSPPRPPPTAKAALEMVMGRRLSMIASYKERRKSEPSPLTAKQQAQYWQWVNEFMLDGATITEMREGARQLLKKVSRG